MRKEYAYRNWENGCYDRNRLERLLSVRVSKPAVVGLAEVGSAVLLS